MKKWYLLQIVSVTEALKAKNGRLYKTIEFREICMMGEQQMLSNKANRKRNVFAEFTDAEQRSFQADPLFYTATPGAYVAGEIKELPTTPYYVYRPDGTKSAKAATKITVIWFEGEDIISVTNRNLRRNAACVVDSKGNPTLKENLALQPVIPNVGEEEAVMGDEPGAEDVYLKEEIDKAGGKKDGKVEAEGKHEPEEQPAVEEVK